MKLRTRLALTLGIATVAVLFALGWAQSRWHSRMRVDALAEAAVHRMESGGRSRCEANPESWPPARGRRNARRGSPSARGPFPKPRFFAYDANYRSRNPASPPFPPALRRELDAGNDVASTRSAAHERAEVAVRMPWDEGPCAVVLLRAKGPPPWFSGAMLIPPLLIALVVIVVALFAAGPIVRRVRQLTESVRRLGAGSDERIHVEGSDEIAELGAAFEQSRQTIQAQLASLRAREVALRNYIANTTHDVMLPLSVLQGHLVSLQQRIEAGETLDAKAIVPSIEESQYLGSLLHNLNAAARLEATEGLAHYDTIDLNRLVERVVDRQKPVATRKQIALEVGVPDALVEVQGDLTLLEQALGNLVQNAVRYNRSGGHVAVVLSGRTGGWTLEVIDDGPGIPDKDRARVLEPSVRGSEARTRHPHGMGLGLHIVNDVAKRHRLRLELRETDGGGLTVVLSPGRDT
ncbi:MAG: HAMP domain-containing histidine kinase [Myxococcales bacterium]|nr:MAG: HAMP domain-containing histidine kinase [Myxococcales bacterium]